MLVVTLVLHILYTRIAVLYLITNCRNQRRIKIQNSSSFLFIIFNICQAVVNLRKTFYILTWK